LDTPSYKQDFSLNRMTNMASHNATYLCPVIQRMFMHTIKVCNPP